MNFHNSLRHSLIAASIALLAACGGGGSSEPAGSGSTPGAQNPPPAAQSFTLALSIPKALILQGTSVTVDATVTRSAGFEAAIDLAARASRR